jgi:hypothetical protein
MDESVRLRAIVEGCEQMLEQLQQEPGGPPTEFVETVERVRAEAHAKLAALQARA